MPPPRAVLFDFNGTLSQDEPLLLRIYQSLFARYGKPLSEEEYFGQLAGLTEEAIVGGWLGVDGPLLGSLMAERIAAYAAEAADGATVTEEVRAAVRYAAERVPVAIVSGAFRAEIEPVVAAAGLAEQVTAVVAADDVEHGKPHPEGYLARSRCSDSTRRGGRVRGHRSRYRLGDGCRLSGASRFAARCPTAASRPRTSSSRRSTSRCSSACLSA